MPCRVVVVRDRSVPAAVTDCARCARDVDDDGERCRRVVACVACSARAGRRSPRRPRTPPPATADTVCSLLRDWNNDLTEVFNATSAEITDADDPEHVGGRARRRLRRDDRPRARTIGPSSTSSTCPAVDERDALTAELIEGADESLAVLESERDEAAALPADRDRRPGRGHRRRVRGARAGDVGARAVDRRPTRTDLLREAFAADEGCEQRDPAVLTRSEAVHTLDRDHRVVVGDLRLRLAAVGAAGDEHVALGPVHLQGAGRQAHELDRALVACRSASAATTRSPAPTPSAGGVGRVDVHRVARPRR